MEDRSISAAVVQGWRWCVRVAHLAVGVPDYATYVAHVRLTHPELTPMSPEAFARDRIEARYGRGRSRCC
jgi:uncharacterized short protein YbdD (DUF466 family)